jgi:hypothetical protein
VQSGRKNHKDKTFEKNKHRKKEKDKDKKNETDRKDRVRSKSTIKSTSPHGRHTQNESGTEERDATSQERPGQDGPNADTSW